jgi:hypothetical protein
MVPAANTRTSIDVPRLNYVYRNFLSQFLQINFIEQKNGVKMGDVT